MFKKISKRVTTFVLAVLMVIAVAPLQVFAEGSVTNFNDFMVKFKQLEVYADEYAAMIIGRDPGELVLNFIRTGVDRYQDDNWVTLAGEEIVGFTNYVKEQDAKTAAAEEGYKENVKDVMDLRDIVTSDFKLPNGNKVDFGHMFGCMNISYVTKGSADLSGWAGDLCDLLNYCVYDVDIPSGTIDQMAAYILKNCFGVDADNAFGWDDFWGDMDAYYLVNEYKKGGKKFSEIMQAYFTEDLNDVARSVYFMNNRFAVEDTNAAVRKAIYESYFSDISIKILESSRGLTSYNALREACCYAFADYIYSQAEGLLVPSTDTGDAASNGYYTEFSWEHTVLAPGIEQDIKKAQTVDGKQIVYYLATVNVNDPTVTIMVNYKDNKAPLGSNIGLQTVQKQTEALVNNYKNQVDENGNKVYENFNAIVATNGAGYNITNGIPGGLVVMQGVEYYPVGAPGFFAILKDGTAMIGTKEDYEDNKEQIREGIAAFGAVLIKDGKINVTKSNNYTSQRASRTAIGITKEGKVVMMVLDGRQLPFSAGGSMEEIAQIMFEAGCVEAVNLDGGGSTTYLSKPAGSDEIQLVNRPSDGYARSVATSLVAVSTAAPSNAFDHAKIETDYEYITAGTSMNIKVTGVSNTGNSAPIPEGAYWKVSDETIGTIDADGTFVAKANGTVELDFMIGDESAGKLTIHVVVPDALEMEVSSMKATYGQVATLPLIAKYQGNRVCVKSSDFITLLQYSNAGTVNGLTFIPNEDAGYRTFLAGAGWATNPYGLNAYLTVNLYREDETTFDFDNATSGNLKFAWLREVSNTHTLDDELYTIVDKNAPIEIDYTFAMDMSSFDIPERLEPMMGLLPTGNQKNATAWSLLLQLAERVCIQTKVTITAEFSKELDINIDNLKIVNEYFEVTSVDLDENNVLTIVCNWIDQTASIAPESANPLCMLTGLKATVKDSAKFYNNELALANNGTVSYDIYLAASSLYSYVTTPENDCQNLYGLYPYIHVPPCRDSENDPNEDTTAENKDKGAYFSNQYIDFADYYVISSETRHGWIEDYYYENNVPVTGLYLTPHRTDNKKWCFYNFDEKGKLVGVEQGSKLIEFKENLYYAVNGEVQTGWQQIDDNNYYFLPSDGSAVDGVVSIAEKPNSYERPRDYTYTFENHILVRGDLVYETTSEMDSITQSGWRYRWAGQWKQGCWFEVDGNTYHVTKNIPYFVTTGFAHYINNYAGGQGSYLFDERGVLQKEFTGPRYVEWVDRYGNDQSATYFFKNGVYYSGSSQKGEKGIVQGSDGYYYFVSDGSTVITSKEQWVSMNDGYGFDWSHGLVAANKNYTFDEYGRMTTALFSKDIVKNETKTEIETTIMGRALTVKSQTTCKVMYKGSDDKYHILEAKVNPYATATLSDETASEYNFAVPADATEIKIVVAGDLDGDGKVSTQDATDLLNHILGKLADGEQLSEEELLIADANGDGKFTAVDVALINAAAKGKIKLDW